MLPTLLSFIPALLIQTALDTVVDIVADQARKVLSDEVANNLKKLRSDAGFKAKFEAGLKRAVSRFGTEYQTHDPDLVAAIAADKQFFQNPALQAALMAMLKQPGVALTAQRETVSQRFATILPTYTDRERVERAIAYLLRCLTEELWNLPEFQPIYSLQFQRLTAEATRQQVELQKAQLQALTSLDTGVRTALLQLTESLVERKLLADPNAPPVPAPKPRVYHNLPQPDYGTFVGREAELAQVSKILRPYPHSQHALVTIDGVGGIGKSALALEIAHRYLRNVDQIPPEECFDAIIWTSAKQTVLTAEGIVSRRQILRTLNDIYTAIAVALQREDITRAKAEEQDEVVRNALTRQRTLLIVDNLETVDDESVMQFLRELPAPTKAIVTTRHRLDVAYPARLVGMPWNDAQHLIAHECQKKAVTLAEPDARRLYDRTGGVPLALVWSIAQMGMGYGVEAVLTRLGQPNNDIAKFCFEGALARLKGTPAYQLLLAASLFATDASREALGFITELSEFDRDDGLVMLEKLSLINKTTNRFDLLPLTEAFISAVIKNDAVSEKNFQQRYIRYFSDYCRQFGGEQWRLYHRLDGEYANIQRALLSAYQLHLWREVGDLASNLVEYLDRRGGWNDLVKYSEMAVEAGFELNDQRLVVKHQIFGLAWINGVRFEKYDEALPIMKRAKSLALEINDEQEYAKALFDEADMYRRLRRFIEAKQLLTQSLAIWTRLGDTRWEARLINLIGGVDRDQGNYAEAMVHYSDALARAEKIDDTELITMNSRSMGMILLATGKLEQARSRLSTALSLAEHLSVPYEIANDHLLLARVEINLGNLERATDHAQKSREIYSRLGRQQKLLESEQLLLELTQAQASVQ